MKHENRSFPEIKVSSSVISFLKCSQWLGYSKFLIYEYLSSSATIFMISKVYQGSLVCVCVCFWVTFTKYLHPYRILSSIWSRGIMIWPHLLFSVIFSSQRPPVLMNRRRFFVSPQSFSELDPWLRQDTWIISLENNACGYGVSEITIYNREFTWFLNFHFMIFVKNKKKINMRLIKVFGGCGSSQ